VSKFASPSSRRLDGLVIPGGESTTFMRLMRLYGLDEALRGNGAIFGTCAVG
jgi:glutamine amidotransferase PdxT